MTAQTKENLWIFGGLGASIALFVFLKKTYSMTGAVYQAGTTNVIVAFCKGGKYYQRIQPQCVTTPCKATDKEISKEQYEKIKADQAELATRI